jgi:hypothetical protein
VTDPNKTHITMVCDRSGSMSAIRSDAEGAVNAFITEQRKTPGECSFLLIDFDAPSWGNQGNDPWYTVCYDGPMKEAKPYLLTPRGNTALFDAIGTAIVATGERLSALPEDQRPGKVIFVFQTDGQENSSREWPGDRMRDAIKHQEETYGWVFIPLGVGADAFGALEKTLVGTQSVSNMVQTTGSGASAAAGYGNTSSWVASARSASETDYLVMASSHTMAADVDDEGKVTAKDRAKAKHPHHQTHEGDDTTKA